MLGLGRCQTRQVSTAATAAAATVTLLGDVAGTPGFDVVVGDIAAVGSLVPDAVAFDIGSGSLTCNRNVSSFLVAFDYSVGGSGTRATVDLITGDGVSIDYRCNGGESKSQKGTEHHLEEVTAVDVLGIGIVEV